MVCKICFLEHEDESLFSTLVGKDTYKKCAEIEKEAFERYEEYNAKNGNPELIDTSAIFTEYKDVLHKMYSSESKEIAALKSEVKKITGSYCPLCGLPNEPSTVEHYLPKEEYPEFSIYSKNLVPACFKCNTNKGRAILDESNKRTSLHVYFEDLCAKHIIELSVAIPYESGAGQIASHSELEPDEVQVVDSHLRLFKINERYRSFFPDHYYEFWTGVNALSEFDREKVKFRCQSILEKKIERFGHNYWEVLLYRTALNTDLFDYMYDNESP